MSDILEKLFGSASRIKILRLFMLHPGDVFTNAEIVKRSKCESGSVRREVALLKKIGLIKQATKELVISFNKRKKVKKTPNYRGKKSGGGKYTYQTVTEIKRKKIKGWTLNELFPLYHALRNLILNAAPTSKEKILSKIKKLGKVKLIILSGIFIQEDDSRLDILVVGDGIKKGALEKVLSGIEADVGKELDYALLDTKEFTYRLSMYDKFIRDVLDYPHEKILDRLRI